MDFGDQKLETKDKTATQFVPDDPELNPVKHFTCSVRRLQSYPGHSKEWDLHALFDGKKLIKVTGNEILTDGRILFDAICSKVLGLASKEMGTHPKNK